MKALGHVSDVPVLEKVAQQAAAAAGIGETWNVRCDVIVYRNPYDKIGWHANDTQDEDCIFSVIPHAAMVRALHIAPKGSNGKLIKANECREGDEQLKIYPAAGDAYKMDGEMQKFYVHSVPRINNPRIPKEQLEKYRRIALIFRHGCEKRSEGQSDKGLIPPSLEGWLPLSDEERHPFGPMRNVLEEGNVYLRAYLQEVRAFSSMQGGISGTMAHGCSAIVVSRQSPDLFELDLFSTLAYSSTVQQGAGALFKTYNLQQNYVRVFRSTALEGPYGARNLLSAAAKSSCSSQRYRYDGLYRIAECWVLDKDLAKWFQPQRGPTGSELYTFRLKRMATGDDGNVFSTEAHMKRSIEMGTMDLKAWQALFDTTESN